jgi:hypothetical protein
VGSCAANTTAATKTSITVVSKAEYQWTATIPVTPDTTYCYRVYLGGTDLLGSDASPTFTSQVAAGSSAPFSFDVFGDWGQAYTNGNPDQANVLQQMSLSGARFAVMTGDTAYPGGGQSEYGDLQQSGANVSTVFGPSFWAVPGRSLPVFNVTGNHGFTNGNVQVVNWPEKNAATSSGGRYAMELYPSVNGTSQKNYPSMWYAFDAGNARFYILTTAWSDSNTGTASVYQDDHDQHWTVNSAEYQWLQADLAAHPNALKFAFWHYPLYADSKGQPSDTFLQGGPGTLQGLLDQNHVAIVFNGHAHGYERNRADTAGLVSYVLGNGGAAMGSVSGCSSFDLYALGSGGTHCGAAPAGLSVDHVYGFARVTVNGNQVTVAPTDEMGRTFDVQTYTFNTGQGDQPPSQPTGLTATAPSPNQVALSWTASTDDVGVTGDNIYRDGAPLATTTGSTATTYTDGTASPATTYTYAVSAVDTAGQESPSRATVTITTPATSGTTVTFSPSDDATVDASQPDANLGSANRIVVDNSPLNWALLKFQVSLPAGCTVGSATLRLTVGATTNDNSVYGGDVYGTSTSWTESTVTWNTRPAPTTGIVSKWGSPVALSTSYPFDVTSLVPGSGTVGIMVQSPNSDGARYYSKNSSGTAPQLQVVCA